MNKWQRLEDLRFEPFHFDRNDSVILQQPGYRHSNAHGIADRHGPEISQSTWQPQRGEVRVYPDDSR